MNECWFDHEKLDVYQDAIGFVGWVSALLEECSRLGEVKDQLDRASTSIPLNIAEGNGKYAPRTGVVFSTSPMGLRWNVPQVLTFLSRSESWLPSRFDQARNACKELCEC